MAVDYSKWATGALREELHEQLEQLGEMQTEQSWEGHNLEGLDTAIEDDIAEIRAELNRRTDEEADSDDEEEGDDFWDEYDDEQS